MDWKELKLNDMNVIFLDVDGVLNSEATAVEHHEKTGKNGFGGFFNEEDEATHDNVIWGQCHVDELRRIVEATNSKIVMSSTWRKMFSVNKFKEMFSVYGWNDAPVIDKTEYGFNRTKEILDWIESNNPDQFIIIDDISDFGDKLNHRLVNTDPYIGLTKEDADKAINLFKLI